MRWHRVIFDESHVARRSNTVRWKSCVSLDAKYRWAVTGTPLVNGTLQELYCQTRIVCPDIQIAASGMHWGNSGFLFLLSHIATRYSKHMRINGQPILELPDLDRLTVRLNLSPRRQRQYDTAEAEMRMSVTGYSSARLLTAVDRMRRTLLLMAGSLRASSPRWTRRVRYGGGGHRSSSKSACSRTAAPICLESIERPGPCAGGASVFCYRCIRSSMQHGNHQCPLCRRASPRRADAAASTRRGEAAGAGRELPERREARIRHGGDRKFRPRRQVRSVQ